MVVHTIKVAPHSTNTSPSHRAGAAHLPHSHSERLHPRHPVNGHTAVGASGRVPSRPVEQRESRDGRGIVDDRFARQGVIGHRRRRPVPGRIQRLAGRPAQKLGGLTHRRHRLRPCHRGVRYPTPGVAVQQPGCDRPASGIDSGQRWHHRGNGQCPGVGSDQPVQCCQWSPPPRFVGVVLQPVGGRHRQLVANPYPRRHPTVVVGGHRFDGGGADIDADCDVVA